jgi:hypothetical protein
VIAGICKKMDWNLFCRRKDAKNIFKKAKNGEQILTMMP